MADKQIKYTVNADDSPFAAALRRVETRTRELDGRIGGLFGGLTASFGKLTGMVAGVSALLAGGGFVAGIKHAIDLQDEMYKGAQKVGVSTQAFSELVHAGKQADLSVEDLTKGMVKLSATLTDGQQGQKQAVELFRRLKLDPQNIKDSDQLLTELADRFAMMAEGAAKTSLAVDVFGEKLGPRLVPFLNQGRAGLAELREEARRLGVTVSDEAGKRAEEFNDNLTKLGAAGQGAANAIAKELVPSLVNAADYFVKATKEAGLFEGTLISIGALLAKVMGIDDAGKLESKLSGLRDQADRLKSILIGVENVLQRDPENDMAQRRFRMLTQRVQELNAEILKTSAELARLSGAGDAGAGRGFVNPATVKGQPEFTPEAKKPDDTKEQPKAPEGYMAYYQLVLAEEQRVQSVLTAGREFSKDEELAFWSFLLDNADVTTKDRVAILKRTADLEVAIARKSSQERSAIAKDDADTAAQLQLIKLQAEQDAARTLLVGGEITHQQYLAMEANFEQQRYEIKHAALQARLALLEKDPEVNAVEMARLKNEVLQLEVEHEEKRKNILNGIKLADKGQYDFWGDAERGMQRATEGILNRTMTLRQGLASAWASIRQSITGEIARIIAAQVTAWVRKRAMALGEIAANAATAGSGGASAMASIPYVGPFLAIAAMATLLATVGGLSSKVPSAARGWDIPSGINPLTQLHEREMVLPAEHADAVRRMAGAGGGDAPIHIHTGGGDWVHKNDLVKLLKQAKRDFHIV